MPLIIWILAFTLLGSIGAIIGASFVLVLKDKHRSVLIPSFVSYATGTLLGSAFLGMIPKALHHSSYLSVSAMILVGIILFFLLEKLVIWRHCHKENCETHTRAGPLILIGDAFHNFIDGVVIATAFLSDIRLGMVTSIAVIAHEIPQEMGDFAILLQSGYTRQKALLYNFLSAISSLPGAAAAYFYLKTEQVVVPYVLAISAASFIYIALADLIPGLHRTIDFKKSIIQLFLMLGGIGTIALFALHHG
ncbi:MAG: ZIP family metal transporter [Syntrophaceae bacterium]